MGCDTTRLQTFVGPADVAAGALRVYALWLLALGLPTCNNNNKNNNNDRCTQEGLLDQGIFTI